MLVKHVSDKKGCFCFFFFIPKLVLESFVLTMMTPSILKLFVGCKVLMFTTVAKIFLLLNF